MSFRQSLYASFILILFTQCNKSNLQAPAPFYLNIQSVSVQTVTGQGTTSHKISDLWIYENGQFKGVYPIAKNIPITSSPARIKIFPGIKKDGLSAVRIIYPFYAPIEIDTSVVTNTIIYKTLSFNYSPSAQFKWIEDFENFGGIGGITIVKGTGSDTTIVILDKSSNPSADVYEGNKCMLISLDNNRPYAYLKSANTYTLSFVATYLELNYKCNQVFEIGVYNNTSIKSVIYLNPTSGMWNKIYIDLTPYLSSLFGSTPSNNSIGIYFKANKPTELSQGEILMDNLKLISY